MTFSLARQVGETGKVITFEYNEQRQKNIQNIFTGLGYKQVKYNKKELSTGCA